MKLQPDFVGLETVPGQPRPFERVLALLDVLLRRSALVVKLKHAFISNRQRGDHEADARKQFARMPFHLGHNPARSAPAFDLIGEVGIMAFHITRWPSRTALEEVVNTLMQNLVGPQPDGIAETVGFQIVEQFENGEGSIGTQIPAPQTRPAITFDHGVKHRLSSMRAVNITGAQGTAFQVAMLVEDE